ncbi:MAG: response regulator [Chloroflexi bacterium]|nr:response regulator [Chloroflexota bacterium]
MNSKATILIVDDEVGVRTSLAGVLTHSGYHVVTVDSGEAALERIATQEFDLALIDLRMKEIGGIEVLSALRQQSPDTIAIVLTAHGSLETATEALRHGAHDYLFKPCKVAKLQESVRMGLLKRQQKLQKQAQIKFASDVSHELRTPLTSIGLRVQMLERSKPEKHTYHINILKQEVRQMTSLTEKTLAISRLQADTVEMEFAPENLNTVIAQIVATHLVHANAAGLELVFEPDPALPLVRAERGRLAQVINNLLTNAVNYTPTGQVCVSTSLDVERGLACLQVRDTGIGIDPKDLPNLFKRFYRGLHANQLDIPGTGLGLSIVKEIVDLHGGEIEVESQVGEGSTFRVWLPLEGNEPPS